MTAIIVGSENHKSFMNPLNKGKMYSSVHFLDLHGLNLTRNAYCEIKYLLK